MLSLLLPLSHSLSLSLDSLNKSSFTPESKDEDLHAGVLQLPQGTVLLVSEGGVREGQLLERGTLHMLQSPSAFFHLVRIRHRRDEHPRTAGGHGHPDARLRLPLQPVLVPDRHCLRRPRRGPQKRVLPHGTQCPSLGAYRPGGRRGDVQARRPSEVAVKREAGRVQGSRRGGTVWEAGRAGGDVRGMSAIYLLWGRSEVADWIGL